MLSVSIAELPATMCFGAFAIWVAWVVSFKRALAGQIARVGFYLSRSFFWIPELTKEAEQGIHRGGPDL